MATIEYQPVAGDALFDGFPGVVTADPGPDAYAAHDPTCASGKYVYKPVQDEILKLIEVAITGNAALEIRNETGGDLSAGTLVYASGYDADEDKILVSKADASDENKLAQFVLLAAVADAANGLAWACVKVTGLDTSGAGAVGDIVYLDAVTPGAFVFTAPSSPSFKQAVGVVRVKHATTGEIHFLIGAAGGVSLSDEATACEVVNATAVSVSDATNTELIWSTATHDASGLHTTSGAEITVNAAGIWDLRTVVEFAANATGRRWAGIYKDYGGGSEELLAENEYIDPSATRAAKVEVARRVELAASDVLSVVVYQDSGGALSVCAGGGAVHGFFSVASVGGSPAGGGAPGLHAASHIDGTDDIDLATTSTKGLMAAADKILVDLVGTLDADGELLVGDTTTGKPAVLAGGTVDQVLTMGASSPGWQDSQGSPGIFNARLTASSGVAVTTLNASDVTTLYLTPHRGNKIGLYSSADAKFTTYTLTEISKTLSALIPNVGYVVWVKASGGAPVLDFEAFKKVTASNNPSAGSSVTINLADTGSLAVGDVVTVKDGSNNETAQIKSLVASTSITVYTLAASYTAPDVYFSNEFATAIAYIQGVPLKTGDTDCRFVGAFWTTDTDKTQDTAKRRLVTNWENAEPREIRSEWTGSGLQSITSTVYVELSGSGVFEYEYLALGQRPSELMAAINSYTNYNNAAKLGLARFELAYIESHADNTSWPTSNVMARATVGVKETKLGYQKFSVVGGCGASGALRIYLDDSVWGGNPTHKSESPFKANYAYGEVWG